MDEKNLTKVLTYSAFFATIAIVLFSSVSIVFPALIISIFSIHENDYDPFEPGLLALPLLVVNAILLGVGFVYYKKKFPSSVRKLIEFILNFEISKKVALIVGIVMLSVYIGFTVEELSIDESTQWADYKILDDALKLWPYENSDDFWVNEQLDRYVRLFLLDVSLNIFQNIKLLPFVASILLVIVTYFVTFQISHKRFAGIVSMAIVLQSFSFLKYDTIAVYENFWVLFYILSLYAVYKRWYLSPVFYLLSVFTKAFVTPFLLMNVFFIYRSKIKRKTKIYLIISYVVVTGIVVLIFSFGNAVYGDVLRFDVSEFWIGFTAWSYQMHLDSLLVLTIIPLTIGLFLKSKNGFKEADSILVLIFGALLVGPVLALLTEHYFILPYRFVPLIVFFAIGVGVFLSNKKTDDDVEYLQEKMQKLEKTKPKKQMSKKRIMTISVLGVFVTMIVLSSSALLGTYFAAAQSMEEVESTFVETDIQLEELETGNPILGAITSSYCLKQSNKIDAHIHQNYVLGTGSQGTTSELEEKLLEMNDAYELAQCNSTVEQWDPCIELQKDGYGGSVGEEYDACYDDTKCIGLTETECYNEYGVYAQDSQISDVLRYNNIYQTNSTYLAYLQIQIRNSDGMLVGITESDTIFYIEHPWTEAVLNSYPVVEIIERNGIQYEKINIEAKVKIFENIAYPITYIYSPTPERIALFSANHHSLVVDDGYIYHAKWTIFRTI